MFYFQRCVEGSVRVIRHSFLPLELALKKYPPLPRTLKDVKKYNWERVYWSMPSATWRVADAIGQEEKTRWFLTEKGGVVQKNTSFLYHSYPIILEHLERLSKGELESLQVKIDQKLEL